MADGFHELDRGLKADRGMRANVIVVVSERLAFEFGIFQRQKPVLVDAFSSDLAVEGFDKAVICRLAWTAEVENHAVDIGP